VVDEVLEDKKFRLVAGVVVYHIAETQCDNVRCAVLLDGAPAILYRGSTSPQQVVVNPTFMVGLF
jgi:hypothetical protein